MGVTLDYKKEIMNLTKELPEDKLREVIDLAHFLKAKYADYINVLWNNNPTFLF